MSSSRLEELKFGLDVYQIDVNPMNQELDGKLDFLSPNICHSAGQINYYLNVVTFPQNHITYHMIRNHRVTAIVCLYCNKVAIIVCFFICISFYKVYYKLCFICMFYNN